MNGLIKLFRSPVFQNRIPIVTAATRSYSQQQIQETNATVTDKKLPTSDSASSDEESERIANSWKKARHQLDLKNAKKKSDDADFHSIFMATCLMINIVTFSYIMMSSSRRRY